MNAWRSRLRRENLIVTKIILVGISLAMVSVLACDKKEAAAPSEEAAATAEAKPAAEAAPAEAKPAAEAAPAEAKPAAEAPKERLTGPVAKVNDAPVASADFYAEIDKITSRGAKIPADRLARIEENILKRLIEKELIRQAIEKASLTIQDAEVDAAFDVYKKRFQTDEQFDNYIKHGKVTIESIRERIKQKQLLEKLVATRGSLEITDAEGKEFYTKNERFYLEKEGVRASHVLVKLSEKAGPDQEKAAMDKIKKVQAKLKGKASFAEVAKEFSEGPTAPKGGDLGFFGKGQMVKAFEDRAFSMKKGEVSGPVRTKFGFHIIQVTDRRDERKKPYDEVKEQIVQTLKNKRFFQERRKLLDELRTSAKVERFLPEPPAAAKAAAPVKIVPPTGAHGHPHGMPKGLPKAHPPIPASAPTKAPAEAK